jgi:predicted nucleic acid-binding protein
LIDSWAWIEYFKGSKAGEKAKEIIEKYDEDAVVSVINIAEVYKWILKFYDENIAEEKRMFIKRRAYIREVDENLAVEAAKIRHEKGWGLGDSIIYATAIEMGAKILTGDPDLKDLDETIFIG